MNLRAMPASTTHLVLLPTYNTGPRLVEVVAEVLRTWQPVLVVVDGSTDGSAQPVVELAKTEPGLTVLVLPHNSGKGAAVLAGAAAAQARGFTHALVMDADGQHPAGSIAEFMAASERRPDALIIGRPVFPPNIPRERLHGRKLSNGIVWLELLGNAIDDTLFGFRIYPLAPLLAVIGPRRDGRRYDFETVAAVRLVWAGVPTLNLSAPVRYFSRAEGGVSHFHYFRDNVQLVRMHTRLLAELIFRRWPALLRHRRRWRNTAVALALLCLCLPPLPATETDPLVKPEHRLAPEAPAWRELTATFSRHPDITANFTERRFFPFKKEPVELAGEARVSVARGLSLHYTTPENRLVILDEQGVLLRAAQGEKAPPADPRAAGANEALRQVLRFDLAALAKDFELYGERDGDSWNLTLVPRTDAARQGIGRISVLGDAAVVRRIELRRTAKQAIEISIDVPRSTAPFTPEELKAFFR